MRQVTAEQNATARAAIAAYREFSKPYVQRNGWTVIPADAPRPLFDGVELTTDRINAFSTDAELYSLATEKPDKFSAYVSASRPRAITTWTGEEVATIVDRTAYHRNNFGGRFRTIWIRAEWGGTYFGREYDSRDLVSFRRLKAA